MIFVKSKEGLWCRANVVEVLQNDCVEVVKSCPITQLARVKVFLLDYGLTKSIPIQRSAHRWTDCVSKSGASQLRLLKGQIWPQPTLRSIPYFHSVHRINLFLSVMSDKVYSSVQTCFNTTSALFVFSSEEKTTESLLKAANNHLRKLGESLNADLRHFTPQAIRCSLKDLVPYDLVRLHA